MTTPIKPTDVPSEVHRLRRAAWRQHGVAMLDIDRVVDAMLRVEITNLCDGLYGRRVAQHGKEEASVET